VLPLAWRQSQAFHDREEFSMVIDIKLFVIMGSIAGNKLSQQFASGSGR
jgi:hypothetical protein